MAEPRELVTELADAFRTGVWSPGLEAALRAALGKVYAALRRRFQDADCEDGIAEALALLAGRPALFRPEDGSLEGFLYVVARNVVARQHQRQSRQLPTDPRALAGAVSGEPPDDPEPASREDDPRRAVLAGRVRSLSAEQRAILAEFAAARAGEPWATRYARRTGDDPNRVRVALHRLLARLRKDLGAT
jgi:DNA-directed RNA polymerase specialized sigma24 family protein